MSQSSGASIAAEHPTIANLWVRETDSQSGLILTGYCHGAWSDTTANTYEHGAMIVQTDASSGVTIFVNSGTTASPSWTSLGSLPPGDISLTNAHVLVGNASNLATDVAMSGDVTIANTGATTIGAAKVTGAKSVMTKFYPVLNATTNGTTPVNVVAATVPFAMTITGVYLISLDTTAGNITVTDTAGTVATVAKGTTAGALVGATSVANTTVNAGDILTIVSSSAGNASVFIAGIVA